MIIWTNKHGVLFPHDERGRRLLGRNGRNVWISLRPSAVHDADMFFIVDATTTETASADEAFDLAREKLGR